MKIWDSSFELGDAVTDEQLAFFKEHGVIVFRNYLPKEQVSTYIAEQQRLETQWLAEKKEKVNGIPLKFGKDDKGNTTIQRLCFSSLHSDPLKQLLADQRLQALTAFYIHMMDVLQKMKRTVLSSTITSIPQIVLLPKWVGTPIVLVIYLWVKKLCQCLMWVFT